MYVVRTPSIVAIVQNDCVANDLSMESNEESVKQQFRVNHVLTTEPLIMNKDISAQKLPKISSVTDRCKIFIWKDWCNLKKTENRMEKIVTEHNNVTLKVLWKHKKTLLIQTFKDMQRDPSSYKFGYSKTKLSYRRLISCAMLAQRNLKARITELFDSDVFERLCGCIRFSHSSILICWIHKNFF